MHLFFALLLIFLLNGAAASQRCYSREKGERETTIVDRYGNDSCIFMFSVGNGENRTGFADSVKAPVIEQSTMSLTDEERNKDGCMLFLPSSGSGSLDQIMCWCDEDLCNTRERFEHEIRQKLKEAEYKRIGEGTDNPRRTLQCYYRAPWESEAQIGPRIDVRSDDETCMFIFFVGNSENHPEIAHLLKEPSVSQASYRTPLEDRKKGRCFAHSRLEPYMERVFCWCVEDLCNTREHFEPEITQLLKEAQERAG